MTNDELRAKLIELANAPEQGPLGNRIAHDQLPSDTGELRSYDVFVGWDPLTALRCDSDWGQFNMSLMQHVDSLDLDRAARNSYLCGLQIEDAHWSWINKSIACAGNSYSWFFMISGGSVEAACLTYHPKPSALGFGEIYYIEFVAVAPWNRPNPLGGRRLSGAGRAIIRHVRAYCGDVLKLSPGFSLHALPKAEGFYEKLGMIYLSDYDKQGLKYYEMPADAEI